MNKIFDKTFLENNGITTKKSTPFIPLLIFATSAVSFGIAFGMSEENGAKMPTLMIAFILAVIGIIKIFAGGKKLIYNPTGEEITKRELFFELRMKESVIGMVEKGDIAALEAKEIKNDNLPVKVELYSTASHSIVICRAYHFVPYTYEPLTENKIFKK